MKGFLLFIALPLGWIHALYGQTGMTLVTLKPVLQSDHYNPALFREEGLHIGFPSGAYNFFHTGPAYDDLINNSAEGPSIDINRLAAGLTGNNYLTAEFRFQTFKIKLNKPSWSIGFAQKINFFSRWSYPDELVQLYKDGNQQFIGQTIMIAPEGTVYSHNDYSLTFAYHFSGISLGVRPKLLMGNYYGNTPKATAKLTTSDDIYQLSLQTNFQFDNVGILSFEDANLLNYQVGKLDQWRPFTKNIGGALDLGLDIRVNRHLNIALSALDLGLINWSDGITSYISDRTIDYDGRVIEDIFKVDQLNIDGALDSLSKIFDVSEESSSIGFRLPTRWYAMASYSTDSFWNVAVVGQYLSSSQYPVAASVLGSAQLAQWCTLGAGFGYKFGRLNAGIHGIVFYKKWRGFFALDNVSDGINPLKSNDYQITLGLNLHFVDLAD